MAYITHNILRDFGSVTIQRTTQTYVGDCQGNEIQTENPD